MSDLHHMRVAIIAVDGFEESELTEPKKALEKAGAKAEVVSEKTGTIQGFNTGAASLDPVAVHRPVDRISVARNATHYKGAREVWALVIRSALGRRQAVGA